LTVDDDHLAHDLAVGAGRHLLDLRDRADFSDQAGLRAAADLLSHEYLTVRLAARRVWIVDPLDGTREFGEPGRTDWAVHVALWQRADLAAGDGAQIDGDAAAGAQRSGGRAAEKGGPPGQLVAGAVSLPAQGQIFSTVPGCLPSPAGVQTAAAVGSPASNARLRFVVSRTRPPDVATRIAGELGAELIPLGSAGAKVMAVVTGAVDAYVHAGGQYEWDSAAPVAVARAAGLHASRIDGRPLVYNQPDPRLPDILVCRSAISEMLLAAIRSSCLADGPAETG
jgi:3'(2'), 5'-bisphosphate nucleotidase